MAESVSVTDGVVRWKNTAESGSRKFAPKSFYVSMNGAPEEEALLARALLKSPNQHLPLLPEGEASIERTADLTVLSGDQSRHVIAYEITGLGFAPDTIWLDDDHNARNQFFGTYASGA
ncbi:MAG TPA: hypothetical protein VKD91_08965 [Pyrinomonadaceae bacterium]|nr:hypothetical protein [Pyrinomonadaceae bacterium]